ncbi:MAG: DUF3179 domain-containing (seleno)protein [Halioglobus sp.]
MSTSYFNQPPRIRLAFTLVAFCCAGMAIFAAILMTEAGQVLDLSRSWVVNYYRYSWQYSGVVLALFAGLVYLNIKHGIWRRLYMILAGVGVFFALYAANDLLNQLFPTMHKTAVYISVQQADELLDDSEVVYAVEINGEAVAYPKRFLEIPHVAGKNIGGQDVAMTFCALSNLPVVYSSQMGGHETDLGILVQTHNNLVLYDDNSGEIVQQITGETEFGSAQMSTYANQMMSWGTFKSLYPHGEVFEYKFDRWLDGVLLSLFDDGMKKQFDPAQGPMFPTLRLDDARLPQKEQIWGLNINGEQIAFTRSFFDKQPIYNTVVGGQAVVLSYSDDYDTLGIFQRKSEAEVTKVDIYGNGPNGKLERQPSYNGVFWMVWSHFFPDTKVNQ